MTTISLLTSLLCVAVGVAVLCVNPRRLTNQAFLCVSLLLASWLFVVFLAIRAGEHLKAGLPGDPAPWLRLNAGLAALMPGLLVLLREAIKLPERAPRWQAIKPALLWLGLGLAVGSFCFLPSFIVGRSPEGYYVRGAAYYAFFLIGFPVGLVFSIQMWRQAKAAVGIQRNELQFLGFALAMMFLLTVTATTAGNLFRIHALSRAAIGVVFGGYCFVAWAITHHRIFNAHQVLLKLCHFCCTIGVLAGGILAVDQVSETILPPPTDLLAGVILSSIVAFCLERKLRVWLDVNGDRQLAALRMRVIAIARTEPHPDKLLTVFEGLLREWSQTETIEFLFDRGDSFAGASLKFSRKRSGYDALCHSGWATPESLQRRRRTPATDDLRSFVAEHTLGLVVTAPRESPSPVTLLAVGRKVTDQPFTYPEVQRLQVIAELMDNILTHARLTAQAALKGKMEHLVLMSRGLAHDLKNLIMPISTFILHTDGRFDRASPEGEVHAEAKHSVRIMTDYVRDALFFASRLTPNFHEADLAKVLETVRQLSAARAASRGVEIVLDPGDAGSIVADDVLLQRLIGNLLSNAIDASSHGAKVIVRCAVRISGWIRVEVVDQGCGIAPENLERIFEPYFTTKHFGDDVRGFGLGLTICEKIINLHQGTILVQSEIGRGTRVLVDLPAAPSAFAPSPDGAMLP